MHVAVFSAKRYDHRSLLAANEAAGARHQLTFHEAHLSAATAVLAQGAEAVCAFVNDTLDAPALEALASHGVRLVALRCAGFNNVDLAAARRVGIQVARVPAYSPEAVAEHTLAMILALNRQLHRAHARVREGNFALDGLMGFDMRGKTVGVIGTGRIGAAFVRLLQGFRCRVLAADPYPADEVAQLGATYVPREVLLEDADVISLHCPLTPQTHHMIDADAIARMKRGVMLINTSRGGLVDTRAVIDGLKSGVIGHLGLDVYEEEGDLFFEDLSGQVLQDDVFARLLTFPNVLITAHQAFFTAEAVGAIAAITLENITCFEARGQAAFVISTEKLA